MHIIYHCYGGNHSSVTAAYIHLGLLPSTNIPRIKDLIALKQFDKQKSADIGKIIFIGTDEKNNHVYVLGRKNHPDIIQNVFHELATCFNINNYLLVDVGQYITPFMRIGGFLSRKFGLIQLGRPIVAKGTMLAYPNLCSMVLQVKKNLQTNSLPKKKQGIPFQNVRIYYCTFSFSMAAIQACIKIGLLPPLAMHHKNNIPCFKSQANCLQNDINGKRILIFSFSTRKLNPQAMISSFLSLHKIPQNKYILQPIKLLCGLKLLLGCFFISKRHLHLWGRKIIEKEIKKGYLS